MRSNIFGDYFDTMYTDTSKWFEFQRPFDIKIETTETDFSKFVWHFENGNVIREAITVYEPEQALIPTPELMTYLEQYKQQ